MGIFSAFSLNSAAKTAIPAEQILLEMTANEQVVVQATKKRATITGGVSGWVARSLLGALRSKEWKEKKGAAKLGVIAKSMVASEDKTKKKKPSEDDY
jgi:hypothetical protein